jgi:hypothetical protein
LAVLAVFAAFGLELYLGLRGDPSTSVPTLKGSDSSRTNAPVTKTEADILTSYINSITLSNQSISFNGTSPESMALTWMITNDTTLNVTAMTSLDASTDAIGFSIRQRFPLLVMWFHQSDTDKWARTDKWLKDPNECNWYGISCKVIYDEDSRKNQTAVTQIKLNGTFGYVGTIPSDIGLLSYMQYFEISDTTYYYQSRQARSLLGTLPDTIGLWTALTYFRVSGNFALTGTLPNSIGQWTALTHFNVSENLNMGDLLPNSIGDWSELTFFSVKSSGFDGPLPETIGSWTKLTYFDVYISRLSGTIPDSIGQWTALQYFDISYCRFTGTLPDSIGRWTLLAQFSVISNNFEW